MRETRRKIVERCVQSSFDSVIAAPVSHACATAIRERMIVPRTILGEIVAGAKLLVYPSAALFAFCLALVAYNILSVVKAALRSVHGATKIDQEVSTFYLAEEIGAVARGMMIAIPSSHWTTTFGDCNAQEMARLLKALAKKVRLHHFQKHPRGPKKPPPRRVFNKRTPHVSTARILALRKGQ